MKVTPILFVEQIETVLPFWTEQLGFEKTVEVPEGDHIGFVILVRDSVEIMLQTLESLDKDRGPSARIGAGSSTLYIEVDDFEEIRRRVEGAEIITPERVTFYGMREIAVREPGGHVLCFAAQS